MSAPTHSAELFADCACHQIRKRGEEALGDAFASKKLSAEGRLLAVLSDGLGSGIKANILATMTAAMAMRFAASGMDFAKCAGVMMEALPVCKVRGISYATFTILDISHDGRATVVEMGNPPFLLMRGKKRVRLESRSLRSPRWEDRDITITTFEIQPEDRVIFFSDGVSQAGMGSRAFPNGWEVDGCAKKVRAALTKDPRVSSRILSRMIASEALTKEGWQQARDDISCAVAYLRIPRRLLLLTGPPFHEEDDARFASLAASHEGQKVVCGGTTAKILSRELRLPLMMSQDDFADGIPPVFHMPGFDMVSEGILTLTRLARYLKKGTTEGQTNPAVELFDLLMESDVIEMVVGTKINESHQDPTLPIELGIRRGIIRRVARLLQHKYLKEVKMRFI